MQEKQLDIDELRINDRRLLAVHEAAHVTVAAVLGVRAKASIWPYDTDTPKSERTYAGNCSLVPSSDEKRAVIGIAGFVAENLADGDDIAENIIAEDILEDIAWADDSFSPTDRELLEAGPQGAYEAVLEAVNILTEYKWLHKLLTEGLIKFGEVTDEVVEDTFRGGPCDLQRILHEKD